MIYLRSVCAAALATLVMTGHAQAAVHDDLEKLAQDVTFTSARLYPMQATTLGIAGHDGEFETPSETFRAAYV